MAVRSDPPAEALASRLTAIIATLGWDSIPALEPPDTRAQSNLDFPSGSIPFDGRLGELRALTGREFNHDSVAPVAWRSRIRRLAEAWLDRPPVRVHEQLGRK